MNSEQYWISHLKSAELFTISRNFFGIPDRNQEDKTKLLCATVQPFCWQVFRWQLQKQVQRRTGLPQTIGTKVLPLLQDGLLGAGSKSRGFLLCHRPPASPCGCYCSHSALIPNTESLMMPGTEGQQHLGAARVTVPRTILTEAFRTNLLTIPFSSPRFPQWRYSHRDEFPSCHSSWQWPRCECCHHIFHVSASGSVLPDQSQHGLGVCEPPDLPGNDCLLERSNPQTHHRGSWFAQNALQISLSSSFHRQHASVTIL